MNKETLQSYNTRLNTNNTSLDDVLETINSLAEVTGTLEITENGTYDVKQYAEATVNVAGGGSSSLPTSAKMVQDAIDEALNSYHSYLTNIADTYPTYTTEPVTLYAPTDAYKYYFIRKRSVNSYGIVWLDKKVFLSYFTGGNDIRTTYYLISQIQMYADNTVPASRINLANYSVVTYTSPNYSTIEECLNAIQNPLTTYTTASNSSYGAVEESGYFALYTNLPCLRSGEVELSRKISSDETISVITSA